MSAAALLTLSLSLWCHCRAVGGSVPFDFRRLSLQHRTVISVNASLAVAEISDAAIVDICGMLGYGDDGEAARCTQPVSRTARVRSMQPFLPLISETEDVDFSESIGPISLIDRSQSEALLGQFSKFRIDAKVFSLTYAYHNRRISHGAGPYPELNVCLVGGFSPIIARMIMAYNLGYTLWIFSEHPTITDMAMYFRFKTAMRSQNRTVALISGQSFTDFIGQLPTRQLCDILHVRETPDPITESAVQELAELAVRPNVKFLPSQVIWEQYFTYSNDTMQHHAENSLRNVVMLPRECSERLAVRWEFSTKWTALSQMGLTEDDSNGYAYWEQLLGANSVNSIVYSGAMHSEIECDKIEGPTSSEGIECGGEELLDSIIFITYSVRVFEETAFGIRSALQAERFRHVSVMGDFNVSQYREHLQLARRLTQQCGRDVIALQISIGLQEMEVLTPYYITLQTEQPEHHFFTGKTASRLFLDTLRDAVVVWAMSEQHAHFLVSDFGFPSSRVAVLPLYCEPHPLPANISLENLVDELRDSGLLTADMAGDVDVTFFGSCSNRRERLLLDMVPLFHAEGVVMRLLCSTVGTAQWGHERDVLIAKSKVVLNLHNTNNSSLEVHRVNYLLSRSKCIVSERSGRDPGLDAIYESAGAVVFGSGVEELAAQVVAMLRNDTLRLSMEQRGYALYAHSVRDNTAPLRLAVQSAIRLVSDSRRGCDTLQSSI